MPNFKAMLLNECTLKYDGGGRASVNFKLANNAIGNSRDASLVVSARSSLDDASPLVRGAAVWALSRLLPEEEFAALASRHAATESDAEVRSEWTRAQAI